MTTTLWLLMAAILASPAADARVHDAGRELPERSATSLFAAQGGGQSLSDAIESIRRQGNVERIISAETRVSGGREVHHIKVLTKDGRVKTFKVPGRRK